MNIRPSTDRLPSEDLKQAQLRFDLLMEDFEKARSLLGQLERFISMPLDFNTLHRKTTSLIDGLRMVTERAIENYHYLAENLDDIYEQNVELENAISETHESINARFTFWLHSFWTGDASEGEVSRNVPTFSEFIQSLAEKESPYAYFLAPCGVTHMLICQSIPLESNPEALELHFSTYVDSPDGILQILQRAWNKLFRRPDRMLFHLFHRSRPTVLDWNIQAEIFCCDFALPALSTQFRQSTPQDYIRLHQCLRHFWTSSCAPAETTVIEVRSSSRRAPSGSMGVLLTCRMTRLLTNCRKAHIGQ